MVRWSGRWGCPGAAVARAGRKEAAADAAAAAAAQLLQRLFGCLLLRRLAARPVAADAGGDPAVHGKREGGCCCAGRMKRGVHGCAGYCRAQQAKGAATQICKGRLGAGSERRSEGKVCCAVAAAGVATAAGDVQGGREFRPYCSWEV